MVMITITINIITFIIFITLITISRSISLRGKVAELLKLVRIHICLEDLTRYSNRDNGINLECAIYYRYYCYSINKPLLAAGVSADNVQD